MNSLTLELGTVTVGYFELRAGMMVAIEGAGLDSDQDVPNLDLIAADLTRDVVLRHLRDEIVASGYDSLEYVGELAVFDVDVLRSLASREMGRLFPDVADPFV